MPELAPEVLQSDEIVERMNVASNHLCDRSRFRATKRVHRQQRRLGMNVIEIFDDRQRLSQYFATRQLKRRHPRLGIYGTKFRRVLPAPIFCWMDGHYLVRKALKVWRYTDSIGSRGAEIRIEFHGLPPACIATIYPGRRPLAIWGAR